MIAENVISLADRRLSATLAEREELTGLDIRRIKSEATLAGQFQSSGTQWRVLGVYQSEIAIQAVLAWQILRECTIAANIEFGSDEGDQSKDWVSQKLSTSTAKMKHAWAEDKSLQFSKITPFEARLDDAAQRALAKTATNVDLYTLVSASANDPEVTSPGVVINNTGTIQALQTGAGSVAKISQSFTQTDREILLAALVTVRAALDTLDATQHPGKDDMLGLVTELDTEAAKDRPNGLKVASSLSGIGQLISTVAALKPAYGAIKGAAAIFGVNLP